MRAKSIIDAQIKRDEAAPELAKQIRENNRKAADGGIHAIDRQFHQSRKQEAAVAKSVVKPPRKRWVRSSTLPGMQSLPGYYLEYVRRDNRNRGDHANLSAHLRSGWDFARRSDFDDDHLPTISLTTYGEVIGNDDTILMKLPDESWAERNAEYEGKRDAITDAINQRTPHLDISHAAMPIVDTENRTSVTNPRVGVRTRQRSVAVASD